MADEQHTSQGTGGSKPCHTSSVPSSSIVAQDCTDHIYNGFSPSLSTSYQGGIASSSFLWLMAVICAHYRVFWFWFSVGLSCVRYCLLCVCLLALFLYGLSAFLFELVLWQSHGTWVSCDPAAANALLQFILFHLLFLLENFLCSTKC